MRTGLEQRKTSETEVRVDVNLDGTGESEISTDIAFFNHMLKTLAKYSMMDLRISAKGDGISHHLVEDVGIALGTAIAKAMGNKAGIARAGWFEFRYMMDDAIAEAIIDLSGRGRLVFEGRDGSEPRYSDTRVESFAAADTKEFFWAMAENMKANISIRLSRSGNAHHEIEAMFKAFGKALRMACERDPRQKGIPSTKGVI